MELIVISKDIIIHRVTLPGGTSSDRVVIPIDKVLQLDGAAVTKAVARHYAEPPAGMSKNPNDWQPPAKRDYQGEQAEKLIEMLEWALNFARTQRDNAQNQLRDLLNEKQQGHDMLDAAGILPLNSVELNARIKNLIVQFKALQGGEIPTAAQVAELHVMLDQVAIPSRRTVRERVALLIQRDKLERQRGDGHRDGRLRLAGKLNEIRAVLQPGDAGTSDETGFSQ